MITGKQRSYLRKLGQELDALVFIGKNDVTDNVVEEIDRALKTKELDFKFISIVQIVGVTLGVVLTVVLALAQMRMHSSSVYMTDARRARFASSLASVHGAFSSIYLLAREITRKTSAMAFCGAKASMFFS